MKGTGMMQLSRISAPGMTQAVLLAIIVFAIPMKGLAQLTKSVDGSIVTLSIPSNEPPANVDFVKAKGLDLPLAPTYANGLESALKSALSPSPERSAPRSSGASYSVYPGTGRTAALNVGVPAPQQNANRAPAEMGTANVPFSTARADLDPTPTYNLYPYRAAGKLFFLIGNDTYLCSASLINRGLVVTAAHCVAKFGQNQYYKGWQFIPGYRNGAAPFGTWTAAQARVLTAYFDGSDPCDPNEKGIVCQDDVAVLVLNPQRQGTTSVFAGDRAGWFSYGWDQLGFTKNGITQITQLGYPTCLDNGSLMERNDAQGVISPTAPHNTIIGSLMCGGSSGGPWLINFGIRPTLTGTTAGAAANANVVVGVSSWGSTVDSVKQMGASPFLSSNVPTLVSDACGAYPDACRD